MYETQIEEMFASASTSKSKATSTPWLDAYKPIKLADVAGNEINIQYLIEMIRTRILKNVIMFGPPGTGKTSVLKMIPNEWTEDIGESHLHVLEINASDKRRLSDIKTLSNSLTNVGRGAEEVTKLMLLDEVDNMTPVAQRYLADIIKRAETGTFGKCHFIMACNDISKVEHSLLCPLVALNFVRLEAREMKLCIERYMVEANVECESPIAFHNLIFQHSGGDVRVAVNALQSAFEESNHGNSRSATLPLISLQALKFVCHADMDIHMDLFSDALRNGNVLEAISTCNNALSAGCRSGHLFKIIESAIDRDQTCADQKVVNISILANYIMRSLKGYDSSSHVVGAILALMSNSVSEGAPPNECVPSL